jgi:hypothetical protein
MKRTARPLTPSQQRAREALLEVVRNKLLTLGDFSHLQLRRDKEHVLIEQPGPPDDPEDRFAVLRLTPIGGFRFGLSLARHTGRWEKLPIAGVLTDVLEQAVAMLGPWLAPQHGIVSGTSGTDN